MNTNFNKKDLVSFGKYLLSEGRENSLKQTNIENPTAELYEDRFRNVHDADLANWKHSRKNLNSIDTSSYEGQMLIAAISKIRFESQKEKTVLEVLKQIDVIKENNQFD